MLVSQYTPSLITQFKIVECWPQSNNETSFFSWDACKAAKKIEANYENESFPG